MIENAKLGRALVIGIEFEQARRDGGQPQALPHRRYRDVEAGGDFFLVEP